MPRNTIGMYTFASNELFDNFLLIKTSSDFTLLNGTFPWKKKKLIQIWEVIYHLLHKG